MPETRRNKKGKTKAKGKGVMRTLRLRSTPMLVETGPVVEKLNNPTKKPGIMDSSHGIAKTSSKKKKKVL